MTEIKEGAVSLPLEGPTGMCVYVCGVPMHTHNSGFSEYRRLFYHLIRFLGALTVQLPHFWMMNSLRTRLLSLLVLGSNTVVLSRTSHLSSLKPSFFRCKIRTIVYLSPRFLESRAQGEDSSAEALFEKHKAREPCRQSENRKWGKERWENIMPCASGLAATLQQVVSQEYPTRRFMIRNHISEPFMGGEKERGLSMPFPPSSSLLLVKVYLIGNNFSPTSEFHHLAPWWVLRNPDLIVCSRHFTSAWKWKEIQRR